MSYFDLDTGENGDEKASDLAFWESCGTGCFPGISLLHGAEGFIFGHREPSYQDCAEIMFSEFEYEFYSYQYICIRTNSDNIAMFKIMLDCDSDADGTHTLTFIYTTWKSAGK
ncbi:MAG: hypothetical protein JW793_15985 [Acidobacteria bacterium]|nr:hypothetical protein [Acidobacteriota bacterium]